MRTQCEEGFELARSALRHGPGRGGRRTRRWRRRDLGWVAGRRLTNETIRSPVPRRRSGTRAWLVLMVKTPEAGRVKTRLARGIGTVAATCFYRAVLRAVTMRLARDGRWHAVLAVAPDKDLRSTSLPGQTVVRHRLRQGSGDLGQRMQRLIDERSSGPVLIVGSDIPAIRADHVAEAFRALGAADVVFGPAADGGYWLVGARRRPSTPRLFRGVRWSEPTTLADTVANLSGHDVALVTELCDVDTVADHQASRGWAGRVVLPVDRSPPVARVARAVRTASAMRPMVESPAPKTPSATGEPGRAHGQVTERHADVR